MNPQGRGGSLERDDFDDLPRWQDHLDQGDWGIFSTDPGFRLPDEERPYVPVVDRETGEVLR